MPLPLRSRFTLTAAALTVLALSREPAAFSFLGPIWPQPFTSYYVNSSNLDLPGGAADAAVRAGADTWLLQATAFRFVYAGPSSQTANTNDGINLVLFRNAASGSAIATTYTWYDEARRWIIDADIVFWDGSFRFFAGATGCSGGFYIEDIAAHEFGHALGLGHSTAPSATMYPSAFTCDTSVRSLDADDISGVRALYPPGSPPPRPTGFRIVR